VRCLRTRRPLAAGGAEADSESEAYRRVTGLSTPVCRSRPRSSAAPGHETGSCFAQPFLLMRSTCSAILT